MREHALKQMEAEIVRKYGKGKISRGMNYKPVEKRAIPTGIPELDKALGIGGIPRGRITEIYGDAMDGKTTVALSIARQVQKMGGNILYIDADCALSSYQLENAGITEAGFYIVRPDTMEDAFEICSMSSVNGAIQLIIIDSITALQTRADEKAEMGDCYAGKPQAFWTDQFLRVVTKWNEKNDCSILILNQTREKVGLLFGNPVTTTCGRALKYYAAARVELHRLIMGKGKCGAHLRARVMKNKCAAPFKEAEFIIPFPAATTAV